MKDEIAKYMGCLFKRGLTSTLSGNLSARADDVVYISPTKVPSYRVRVEDVSVVTMKGDHLAGKAPSSEMPMHLAIYKVTASKAIIHAHSRFATALSCLGGDLQPPDVEGKQLLGRIPLIPYERPGTSELADAVSSGIKGFRGALLENHGLVAVGADLEEAYTVAEGIERAAQLVFDLSLFSRR
ncbi:MAG: class II aldolase/adducin family protein [Halobacteriota archaeon]